MSAPTVPLKASPVSPANRFASAVQSAAPGLLLTVIVAMAAFTLRAAPGFGFLSPMILAILIGAALRNAGAVPPSAAAGIRVALRRVLRLAIVLLGLQLTTAQVAGIGVGSIAVILTTVIATFAVTLALGRWLGVDPKLTELIAAGTSICGASAVIAANTVTRAPDEDAAYAVACVTVFGTLSMVLYPLSLPLLHLSAHAYGLWTGASIHEIAQVVAAAFQGGEEAGQFGTIAKLSRVMLLAPLVLAMGWRCARRDRTGDGTAVSVPVPWFVVGFVGLVALNSVFDVGIAWKSWIVPITTFLLTVALAAMGLETDVAKLRARGARPLLLGVATWLFISGASLLLVAFVSRSP